MLLIFNLTLPALTIVLSIKTIKLWKKFFSQKIYSAQKFDRAYIYMHFLK